MDCADEAALIRRALAPNPAVANIEFDLVRGFVDIEFDESRTTESALMQTVSGTGLPAHIVSDAAAARAAAAGEEPHVHHEGRASNIAMTLSGLLFAVGWIIEGAAADHWLDTFVHHIHDPRASVAYGLSAFAGLWPMWPRAFAAVRHLRLDMHALVCVTVAGAAIIGEWSEGAAVAFLFALAHRMEAWSISRARAEIAALVGRGPSLVADGVQFTAPVERWIERFAASCMWFYRALVVLVLACPCALVISTPVTMIAALTSAARRGVLVSGGAVLERAAAAQAPTRAALAGAGVTVVGARDEGAAMQAADVVVTAADDRAMDFLVAHARRAMWVVRQNVAISLLTKIAFLITAPLGIAPLWMAVLADTGATVIVTLNGLRLLRAD
jgi:cation transport ATPase